MWRSKRRRGELGILWLPKELLLLTLLLLLLLLLPRKKMRTMPRPRGGEGRCC